MPDYSEAIDVAKRALYRLDHPDTPWYLADQHRRNAYTADARVALTAAAPIIERQVRERIITELRDKFGVTNRAADWLARTPAPIPPTSEDQCETCGRILSCVGTCSKGCAQ